MVSNADSTMSLLALWVRWLLGTTLVILPHQGINKMMKQDTKTDIDYICSCLNRIFLVFFNIGKSRMVPRAGNHLNCLSWNNEHTPLLWQEEVREIFEPYPNQTFFRTCQIGFWEDRYTSLFTAYTRRKGLISPPQKYFSPWFRVRKTHK